MSFLAWKKQVAEEKKMLAAYLKQIRGGQKNQKKGKKAKGC
ncbi:MAG: hypothetical protein PWQ91_1352 [Eubacteriales bacterium]|nr:hypothetical protein [Eubacteriales bacterium]MDN5364290.1 hypothetical protein [Eubacteriales bacterium]